MFNFKQLSSALAFALIIFAALAQKSNGQYASTVVQFNQGSGSGVFTPANILGAPTGGGISNGSLDVLTLGAGGDVTVGFNTVIVNGPGVDFTVFENGFEFPANFVFTELAYVEVSTDGFNFVRFPSIYQGPQGPFGGFTTFAYGSSINLVGGLPVMANPLTNTIDPLDPVYSGGDSFDLDDIRSHPDVVGGLVDIDNINFVRVVDIEGGVDMDSNGNLIWDSASSADIDAIAAINTIANTSPSGPDCGFVVDSLGFLVLSFSDPDGVMDLDGLSFRASLNLQDFSSTQLNMIYDVVSIDATRIVFRTKFPVAGFGLNIVAAVGISDNAGNRCFDQFVIPQ